MLKKYIFYCVGVLLLAIAGIFGYTKWTEAREKVDLWTLVPTDAVFIIESTQHGKLLKKLQDLDLWENVSAVRSFESLAENVSLLDSLSNRNNGTSRFLMRKTLLTSVHVVGKKDFDFVFYVPINTVGEHRFMRSLIENIDKSNLFKEQLSDYQNYQLTSITNLQNNENFTYFTYHNNLIVSGNADLIKEIIRNIKHGQLQSPAAEYQNINYLTQPEVFAHVFINYRYIPAFMGLFLKPDISDDLTYFASLCRTSMLGFKQHKGELVLNGFSNPETLAGSLYNQVKGQETQAFRIKEYLPNRTALLLHFGLDRVGAAERIYATDKQFTWPAHQLALADSLRTTFRGGMGVGYLETDKDKSKSEKIVFVESGNPAQTNTLLNRVLQRSGSKITEERLGNYVIRNIPVSQFPLLLIGSVARDFETCFVTQVDNYYIFAAQASELRSVLGDIKAGRVWAKTENQKLFLEHTQQEASFSIIINTGLAWSMLNRYVQEDGRSSLLQHERLIKKFKQIALQFSQKENQFYTSFLFTHPDGGLTVGVPEEQFEIQKRIPFAKPLVSAPLVVRNALANPGSWFVQDAGYVLHRLTNNGLVSWSDSLQQSLKSEIYQIDVAKNNQPNYVFATTNTIQCLNGQGQAVENFPFILPDTLKPEYLAVLDLNQKKDYRLLLSDVKGHLVMLDMLGNGVRGWEGKKLESALAATPQIYFVNGKNIILAWQKNGFVYAFNAFGDVYPGFPVALNAPVASGGFVQVGATFRSSFLTVVTQTGKVVKLNFNGQILQQKQLPGIINSRSRFDLIAEPLGKSYILTHQRPGKISIYDNNQRLLLERNFITSSPKIIQFFDFGPLNKVYALTETGPQKTYLYNYQAQLIGRQPLDNKFPIVLDFNPTANAYLLHTVKDKEVRKIVLKAP